MRLTTQMLDGQQLHQPQQTTLGLPVARHRPLWKLDGGSQDTSVVRSGRHQCEHRVARTETSQGHSRRAQADWRKHDIPRFIA